jgi:hypothetical protein
LKPNQTRGLSSGSSGDRARLDATRPDRYAGHPARRVGDLAGPVAALL